MKEYKVEIPEQPAGITKIKDSDNDIWVLVKDNLWAMELGSQGITWESLVKIYGPLTEVVDTYKIWIKSDGINAYARTGISLNEAKVYLRDTVIGTVKSAVSIDYVEDSHLKVVYRSFQSVHWYIEKE